MQSTTINTRIPPVVGEEEAPVLSLQDACMEGALDVVKEIFDQGVIDVNERDGVNWTPLHHAIQGGNLDVVHYLVDEKGANFNDITMTRQGQEALHFACSYGHLDVIKYIAEHGGQHMMHATNEANMRPILLASFGGCFDIVQYLLEECHVDVHVADNDQWTPLHYACTSGDLQTVRYLVEHHDVDYVTEVDLWTPLHCAANKGHINIVKYLLENCNVDGNAVIANANQSALHLAASEGHLVTVKYLVEEQSFRPTTASSGNQSSFRLAARFGMLDVVKYFVERLDISAADRFHLLFSENIHHRTAYDTAVRQVEKESEFANTAMVAYLYSFVAPVAVPCSAADDTCVKLNDSLSDNDWQLAQGALKQVVETEAHSVACHVLSFLCMSDIKR